MIRTAVVAAGLVLALGGCETMMQGGGSEPPAPPPSERQAGDGEQAVSCPSQPYQVLLGQQVGEIDRASLPAPHRIYGPGDAVTMDYRPERLNIVVDEDDTVVEVKCG